MRKIKKIIKKTFWIIQGGYSPEKFWESWAKTFINDKWQRQIHPQHKWLFKKIVYLKPESILEVGCGFGRNIKFLMEKGIDPSVITGIDISPLMLKNARAYVKNEKVKFKRADVNSLPFKKKEFDLTFSHGILMHVKPEDIKKAINEVIRVTKKDLIVIEQNYGGNEYTFIHDYVNLLKGCNVAEYINNKKSGLDFYHVKIREK